MNYLYELEIVNFIPRNNAITNGVVYYLVILQQNFKEQYFGLLNKILDSIKIIDSNAVYQVTLFDDVVNGSSPNNNFKKIIYFTDNLDSSYNFNYNEFLNVICGIYQIEKDDILIAPSIEQLSVEQDLKKQLWKRLQTFCK